MRNESVFDMLERCEVGNLTISPRRLWMSRENVALENGDLTIIVSDGVRQVRIQGTPYMLRRLAEGIVAQVDSAEVNTHD